MADTFKLEIATPDRMLVSGDVSQAQVPGKNGYLGILPGHAPLISELQPGEIRYTREDHTERLAVTWGYVEVLPGKVTILAEAGEKAEEIDVARAEKSLHRAQERLKTASTDVDLARAQSSMTRAMARLHVAGKM